MFAAEPKPNPALGAGDEAPNEKEVDGGTGGEEDSGAGLGLGDGERH